MLHISPDKRTGTAGGGWTRRAGKYLALGLLLVGSVTLITFVFSFLGTILCGAVVGMMAGSSRRWQWPFLLVSLVFPGAIWASLQVTKSAVAGRESLWLPVVCFGIFWATYLLTLGLLCLEKPAEPSARMEDGGWRVEGDGRLARTLAPPGEEGAKMEDGGWRMEAKGRLAGTLAPPGEAGARVEDGGWRMEGDSDLPGHW